MAKHLATQAKRVKDKGLIVETKIKTNDTTQDYNSTQLQDATITVENNQEQNSNITVEDNVDQQRNVCGAEAINVKQDIGVEFDEEALAEMIETIKLAWIGNYE